LAPEPDPAFPRTRPSGNLRIFGQVEACFSPSHEKARKTGEPTMKKPTSSTKSSSKWFWILTLFALLVLVVVWFADPLGKVEDAPTQPPAAQSTEWAPAPEGPAVEVKLPETPVRNPVAGQTESSDN
jgi:hypothetical protein